MDVPLKEVPIKPEASDHLAKWAVKLGEFEIEYHPHPAIMGQALANFVVEVPREKE